MHKTIRRGGQKAGRALLAGALCGLLYLGQASSRPVDEYGISTSGNAPVHALQAEMDSYAVAGGDGQQAQMHDQLTARLSRRGFYRLWTRPLAAETNQGAEAWYDAGTDQTVLCVSWATANGMAQQVWVLGGRLRHQDWLPVS